MLSFIAAVAAARDLDVILYGAYGCVGHFAAQHLASQTNLTWAIAGRNATKLHALAETLAPLPSGKPEIIVASLTGDLSSWVGRAKAIATAAGPFSIHEGENLVKACAALGTSYSDTSDEFYWQRRMITRHNAAAAASGARIALAAGFCALAADIGGALALEAAGSAPEDEMAVDAWLERYSGGISAGVINTVHVNASYPKEWETDPYVLTPNAPPALKRDTIVDGMKYPGLVGGEGVIVPNLFGDYDARLMRNSFVHRNQSVHLRVGSPPALYTDWLALILAHPSSWSTLTKCPNKALMTDGYWRYKFQAKAAASHKASYSATTVTLSGSGDPGYNFTALAVAEVALCLAGRAESGGAACRGTRPGVLSPGLAVNVSALHKRLTSIGLMKTEVEEKVETPAMEATDEEGLKLFEKLGGAEASGVERRAAAIEMLLSQAAK